MMLKVKSGFCKLCLLQTQHIVNYEFPQFLSDYIHRVGRVGRVGSQGAGSVLSYIAHKWEVDTVWKIEVKDGQFAYHPVLM